MDRENGRNAKTVGYLAALKLLKHAQTDAGSGDEMPIGDGFVLRPSGVWRLAGPDAVRSAIAAPGGGMVKRGLLTDEEFDVLASGPDPDAKSPIVPLPCGADEFIRKLHSAGLLDRLPDDEAMTLFWPIRHAVLADMSRRDARRFVRELRRVAGWLPNNEARVLYSEITKWPDGMAGAKRRGSEAPEDRRVRLRERRAKLIGQGVRNPIQVIADEESLSPTRVHQLLRKASSKKIGSPRSASDPFGLARGRRQ